MNSRIILIINVKNYIEIGLLKYFQYEIIALSFSYLGVALDNSVLKRCNHSISQSHFRGFLLRYIFAYPPIIKKYIFMVQFNLYVIKDNNTHFLYQSSISYNFLCTKVALYLPSILIGSVSVPVDDRGFDVSSVKAFKGNLVNLLYVKLTIERFAKLLNVYGANSTKSLWSIKICGGQKDK